mgnify:CR=1 FL=1|tara:strand:- start:741 stop:1157 length:417 start_codon:yes stop_codon:yes gene_type:complete
MSIHKDFVVKLRGSSLRPTKQRVEICELLFDRDETFHFSIGGLAKMIENRTKEKISLATIYNTVHALKEKGYLKEIVINSNQSYYDTNIKHHHHFFDETKNELIDLSENDVNSIEIKKEIPGKKIKSVEVLVRLVEKK